MKNFFVAVFFVLTFVNSDQLLADWNSQFYPDRFAHTLSSSKKQANMDIGLIADYWARKLGKQQSLALLSETIIAVDNLKKELKDYGADTRAIIEVLDGKIDAFSCTCSADDATSIGKIPSSCQDLKAIGNTESGLYSVLGSKQVETVYCDFTEATDGPGFQKWIGYQDVKSMPTYFYVQKTKSFSAKNTPIPFERAILNIGGAMNLESGKFKAPVTGTYFFSFIGLVQYPITSTVLNELSVMLYQNGQVVGRGQFNEVDAVNNVYYLSPVTVQSTLMLKAGDEVWLEASYVLFSVGYLFDSDGTRYTHFNGWLLEEDIAHSL
ncbi:uncharacterized protein LOC116927129 [Daphnia magna]|uniref:uncharacterized protein LOC116927129 n=1 Tax=Daphnia magna TaxID=35525 RepID=UPI001E1BBB98|nr:uncharacterized protein LOC116927129 [Daphnia magna]